MNLSPDEKLHLLKMEFPTLNPDSDEDIERYFELRRNGSHQEALRVYNHTLRRKFPNETTRILLLRYYRANDPRYHILLGQYLRQMADNFAIRVQNAIYSLTKDVEMLDVGDAYAVIKTIEKIIAMLAPDRREAPAAIEKFVAYADKIRYRQQLMRKTAELVRQYIAESLDSVESLRRSIEDQKKQAAINAERAAIDARISAKEKAAAQSRKTKNAAHPAAKKTDAPHTSIFDLSRITFDPANLARIEIPRTITRLEDKVLAYCLRYWPLVSDPAFERTIFLYSKKYGTKHFDIYNVIKIGRAQGRRDGDILTSVLGVLATGYFYSVQGDRYLQVVWRRLHGGENARSDVTAEPVPGDSGMPEPDATPSKTKPQRQPPVPARKKAALRTPQPDAPKTAVPEKQPQRPAAQKQKTAHIPAAQKRSASAAPSAATPKPPAPQKQKQTARTHAPRNTLLRPAKKTAQATVQHVRFVEAEIAGTPDFTCSVADIIKQLSGKSYDVYKDVFLKTVRPYIRKELSLCRTTPARLFDTAQNKAEEAVYTFLAENYDNPFMDWQKSRQYSDVTALGFNLTTVHTVISQWFTAQQS